MDLALEDRIDTDLNSLMVLTTEPVAHPVLDADLARLASSLAVVHT